MLVGVHNWLVTLSLKDRENFDIREIIYGLRGNGRSRRLLSRSSFLLFLLFSVSISP